MGSLTPPWADELLSRNSKIARKMMSSMSTESYLLDGGSSSHPPAVNPSPPTRPNRFLSMPVKHPSDPISNFSLISSPSSTIGDENVSANNSKVVDPPATNYSSSVRIPSSQSPISSPTTFSSSLRNNSSTTNGLPPSSSSSKRPQQLTKNTEKLSPIRNERDSMFVDDEEPTKKPFHTMTNGGGTGGGEDLSIIEYGPGIVKKLRSRYQSLALRQYTARPSLRRSASLENCLDAVSAEELAATLESKIANGNGHSDIHDEFSSAVASARQTRPRNRFLPQSNDESRENSPVPQEVKLVGDGETNGKGGGVRGRTNDASARRDRMRRARSVDALHRTKREEEILEKFKHVVLPKEEIVIIEVSKPQHLGDGSVGNGFAENGSVNGSGTGVERRFPTRLLLTANNLRNTGGVLDQQTANRVRNLMISPEHELPPHDIVRETARIFEKNQDNLNRRIGQALRLSKSASASAGIGSMPLQSPESPTPSQQQKTVMAQGTPSSMQSQDKSFSTGMANGPSAHGQKQIGIIKPTLSATSGLISGVGGVNKSAVGADSVANGGISAPPAPESNRVRSPILSPIGVPTKPLLNHSKPPLSPKPIFTSSPKVNIPSGKGKPPVAPTTISEPSPSTSPILIIEKEQRSLSPFTSDSPIPRVKSPVSTLRATVTSPVGNNDAFRITSPVNNGKVSPPVVDRLQGNPPRSQSPVGQSEKEIVILKKTNNKTVNSASISNGTSVEPIDHHHRQQITKSTDQPPAPPPRTVSPVTQAETNSTTTSSKPVSQLRVHQKQKSGGGGNGSMVFNFTARKEVPDYIEDDGLRRASGGRGDGSQMGTDEATTADSVDSKVVPAFEGGNVIINGKSSIQKRPKSQKLCISFNESATTTHEYPSESSFAIVEEEPNENENSAPKKPNVLTGSSLGSYTPKVGGTNSYQLGNYGSAPFDSTATGINMKKKPDQENDYIEDYLKPNSEGTTWSNEMSADILF